MQRFSFLFLTIFISLNGFSQFSNSQPIGSNISIINEGYISVLTHGDVNNDGFDDIIAQNDTLFNHPECIGMHILLTPPSKKCKTAHFWSWESISFYTFPSRRASTA